MKHNSLTFRLIVTSLLWVGVTLIATTILLIFLFRAHTENHFEALLYHHLEELVSASEVDDDGMLEMSWYPADPRFQRPHSGWYWEIQRLNKSLRRSKSLWVESLAIDKTEVEEIARIQQFSGPEGELLHALAQNITFSQSSTPLRFIVAGPAEEVEAEVRDFAAWVISAFVVLGIGLLLAIWLQVKIGLRPLQKMKQSLTDIRQGKNERLPAVFPEEVNPIVTELNAVLDHNDVLLERARTQTGNLAHALKNPLTVIRNELEHIDSVHARIIKNQTDTMKASMDRCLSRARVAGTANVLGARADVNSIIKELSYYMERLYTERNIKISHNLHSICSFRGESQDLEEMLGNLLDNACKWASSKVRITTLCNGDKLVITVEDDGSGIPVDMRQDVLERGKRADEETQGSGLGLDIVKDITEIYRGTLDIGQSSLGGASVSLSLPRAY